jgi:hypothetical protein
LLELPIIIVGKLAHEPRVVVHPRESRGGPRRRLPSGAGVAAPKSLPALGRMPTLVWPITRGRRPHQRTLGSSRTSGTRRPASSSQAAPARMPPRSCGSATWSRPGTSSSRRIHLVRPRPSRSSTFRLPLSPAGNYPSGIELPSAGCWHLDLTIGSAQAAIDLLVTPLPSPTP